MTPQRGSLKKCVLQIHPSVARGKKTEQQQDDIIQFMQAFGFLLISKAKLMMGHDAEKIPLLGLATMPLVGHHGFTVTSPARGRWKKLEEVLASCHRFEGFLDHGPDGFITMRVRFFHKGAVPFYEDTYDRRTHATE